MTKDDPGQTMPAPRIGRRHLADPARRAALACTIALRRTVAWARPLPDFIILGAQKAGTSSLYASLNTHPSVLPGLRREIHYFDTHADAGLGWYRAHFPTRAARRRVEQRHGCPSLTGEASPYYLFHPAVPERLRRVLPNARMLVLLRDPVDRAVSEYQHAVRHGFENRPIEIALDPDRAPTTTEGLAVVDFDRHDGEPRRRSYLARGHYAEQLTRWFTLFPRQQILVLETSELRAGEALRRALAFLCLTPAPQCRTIERNVHRYPAPDRELVGRLADYYEAHNERLWQLLGRRWDWKCAGVSPRS